MTVQRTMRQLSLHAAHGMAEEHRLRLVLSNHFVERINVRATSSEAYVNLVRCVRFMCEHENEFAVIKFDGYAPTICVNIDRHFYFMRISMYQNQKRHRGHIAFLTYYWHEFRTIQQVTGCDRKFTLKTP